MNYAGNFKVLPVVIVSTPAPALMKIQPFMVENEGSATDVLYCS
jgi:hypothetical protein